MKLFNKCPECRTRYIGGKKGAMCTECVCSATYWREVRLKCEIVYAIEHDALQELREMWDLQ